jgi:HK97 family phage major capsid protein
MTKTPEEIMAEKLKGLVTESEGKMTATLEAKLKELSDGNEAKFAEMLEAAKAQGEELRKLKENKQPAARVGLKEAIKNELKSKFEGKTIDEVKAMIGAGVKIEIKAASTFLTSTHTTGQVQTFEVDPMLDAAPKKKLFLRDIIGVTSTGSETMIVREKYNEDGDATWVAEGSIKSLVDFDMRTQTYHAKQVSATTEVGENSLADINDLMAEIENEIIYEINEKEQHGELFGTGGANDPVGLTVCASAFVITSMNDVVDPNRMDALVAADTQLKTLNFAGNFVAINPIDAALMKLSKDDSGAYLLPTDRQELVGYRVIESNDIPVGSFLLGDSTKTNIKDYQSIQITFGYSGTGFADGVVTIRGSKRVHAYTKTQNHNAFVYDTFANVIAAITAVQA